MLAVGVTLTRAVQCGVVQAGDLFGEIAAITGSRECRKFAKPVVRRRRLKFISLQRACNCGDFGCSVTTVPLVAGRAAVFPIPGGSAGGRRTCRMSCNLDLSAHRTPLPSSSSSSSRPRAVDHHAAVIIQSSVAWSSSSSSRRAVPPASVLSVERARPRRSSLATACITLSTAVLAVRLSTWLCVCVCV